MDKTNEVNFKKFRFVSRLYLILTVVSVALAIFFYSEQARDLGSSFILIGMLLFVVFAIRSAFETEEDLKWWKKKKMVTAQERKYLRSISRQCVKAAPLDMKLQTVLSIFLIYSNSALRLIVLALRDTFVNVHHVNDGPIETMGKRFDSVIANMDYDCKRRDLIRKSRKTGIKVGDYGVYKSTLKEGSRSIYCPGPKIYLDILAPNRKNQ